MIHSVIDQPATGSPEAEFLPSYISPSAAKSFLACSLRFYFERVACIKKPTTVALHLGKAVHEALQGFHLARWRGTDDSPVAVAEMFDTAFTRLETEEGPVRFKDEAERLESRQSGLRVVAAYLDSDEVPKEKPRAVEVPLNERIPGLPVPLNGAVDLVEHDYTPVDYKSSATKANPDQAAFDHEIQLVSYQLLLEAAIGITPKSLDLVYLVKTKTPSIQRVSLKPAGKVRKDRVVGLLNTAVDGIVAERFHPSPGMHCSWCQFKNECMRWKPAKR